MLGQELIPLKVAVVLVAIGSVSTLLYVRHARRTPHAILDLKLFRLPTFRASVTGGSLFRVGIGAIPFLLPLMLQLGLGMTAFQSGSLTFVAAIGALTMKLTAAPLVRRFGFKRLLVVNGFVSAGFVFLTGLFALGMPSAVIITVLLVGGFLRSLQFTCLNTVAYAEVSHAAMSRATSLSSVVQQVSLSTGVAVGALVLETLRAARPGETILASDFLAGFCVVGAITLIAPFISPGCRAMRAPRWPAAAIRTRKDAAEGALPRNKPGRSLTARRDRRPRRGAQHVGAAAEALREHVELGGILAARRGLHVQHLREVALQVGEQGPLVPPWNTLARKAPPGASTSRANSAAISQRCMMRRWSVFL